MSFAARCIATCTCAVYSTHIRTYTPYIFAASVLHSRLVGFHVVAFVIVRRGLFDAKSKVVVPCDRGE